MSSSQTLNAIVVGGGPVGLTAAHALSKAGIDFILLERRPNIVIDAGSNLVLLNMGMRSLDQLGLLDAFNRSSAPLNGNINRCDHSGRDLGDVNFFQVEKDKLGAYPRVVSRHDLTKVLYNGLSASNQAKIHTNKKVSGITPTASGVVVECSDGTSYPGSFVIGADGAHSMVRSYMRDLAVASASPDINAEQPFLTTYRALWIRFPTPAHINIGTTSESHGPKIASQLFSGLGTTVAGIYETLDAPTRDRVRHTEADQAALIDRWGHILLNTTSGGVKLTLREAFEKRVESGLVSLEEGVVDHWSWNGRIVLAGDAAHKFTPSTGAGCNSGIVDVVALVNEIHRVSRDSDGSVPDRAQISAAFKAYQKVRYDTVTEGCQRAGQATASATWQTGVHKFIDRSVMSVPVVQRLLARGVKAEAAALPSVNFVNDGQHANAVKAH